MEDRYQKFDVNNGLYIFFYVAAAAFAQARLSTYAKMDTRID
ncbi:MAG: hypothetical protein ACJAU4_001760 [Glaciecola sp.]|jgi:hypothetical protein